MDVKRFTPKAIGCKNIPLGKQGETNAVRVEFLCAEWLNEYPAARIELHVTIPDGTAYTAKLEESGSTRAWNVTEPYTELAGSGTIELILRDAATSTVIKSVTGRTHVEKSPSADGQPAIPPDESGLNGYVRYDVAQGLTAEERKRARENIGADGAGGVGGYYKPSVDAEGNLTWEKSSEAMPDAEGANIRGPEGKEGKTGPIGPQGPQGTAGHTPYIGENGNWWINGVDTETPATPQGGEGTVTGIQIGSASYAPNAAGVIDLSSMTAPDAAKLGGKAPEYYTWTDNLLLNSNFQKPYLINLNAAGGTYSAWSGEVFNGWRIYATETTIGVTDSGANVSGGIYQMMTAEEARLHNGKTLTFAVKMNGVVYATSGYIEQTGAWHHAAHIVTPYGKIKIEVEDNNELWAVIENNTGNALVEWAVLIPGAYTAETLPQPQWLHPRLEMLRMGLDVNPVNLLDNSDFTNLIAQAGYPAKDSEGNWISGLHGTTVYLADRWYHENKYLEAPTYNAANRIITFPNAGSPNPVRQNISSNISGKVVTLAIKASNVSGDIRLSEKNSLAGHQDKRIQDGITFYSFTAGDNAAVLFWSNSGGTIKIDWIVLYEGAYTLETLPPYRPKENELEACMRRFIRLKDSNSQQAMFGFWFIQTQNFYQIAIPLPERMDRIEGEKPTVTFNGDIALVRKLSSGNSPGISDDASLEIIGMTDAILYVRAQIDTDTELGVSGYIIARNNNTAYIDISTDL